MSVASPDAPASLSPVRVAWRRFSSERPAAVGLLAVLGLLVASLLLPDDHHSPVVTPLVTAPLSLAAAFAAALMGILVASAIGVLAAGAGGWFERAATGLAGRLSILPLPLVAVAGAVAFGRDLPGLLIAIAAVVALPAVGPAHAVMRGLMRRELVTAAHAAGVPPRRILWRHLLPNAAARLAVAGWPALPRALVIECFAGFLGFGAVGGAGTLGTVMGNAAAHGDPVMLASAAAVLGGLLLALHSIGRGLLATVAEEERP
ncbi:ABC transporter permease subunit [Azospirillum sp. RWY-5-1]|uniref:ABC transporter permease subunit n=1 Tax=Azospirillum oleiclasticum TaxID=2735135 RepID=A0ABX2T718_9PROT|nr:ABC transporter permease subunit [Azospirillum oleiclasticum]NYZ13210.1 ABC transporter permease subunit [Azospirillum oleiclasticum]NYZ20117.1 ABC transporter permease subunit [Azospirillum oleiclasticum]